MKTVSVFLTTLVLLLPTALIGLENPSVQIAGLRIVGPGYGRNASELRAFHQQSGITLVLVVKAPENKRIVEVDDNKCAMLEFTDDQDQNLLDGVDWGGFPKMSEDGGLAMIEVSSKVKPSQNASRIHAKGSVFMRVASALRSEEIESLKLAAGTKANIGQEVMEVMKVETDDDGTTLVVQIKRKVRDDMKEIRFYTMDGNGIEIWSTGSFTFGNASQVEYSLDIKPAPEAIRVEIDMWTELENITLPFELDGGVGF